MSLALPVEVLVNWHTHDAKAHARWEAFVVLRKIKISRAPLQRTKSKV